MSACKTEEDQRRWFYSQCLQVKLAAPDKARARKILISDIYQEARDRKIPMEKWTMYINEKFGVVSRPVSPVSPGRQM